MRTISKNTLLTRSLKISISALLLLLIFAFVPQEDEWKAPGSALKKKNPVEANESSLIAGKKLYTKECFSCHGRKGRGDGPNSATLDKIPGDLTSSKVQDQTDGELFWKITQGKKPMPSTKLTLTNNQRWEVVNYIRTLKKKKK
ncbi:hypothetical protein MNBD_BACTEROID01-2616 [hydrothermal vent metagenome]|uniref:Cytochrome c domain-containing protein n=1 Tax=hydrothermal vent metagenome TaxID=652676 RepID=A0A3B0U6T4_9ZZZZ